MKIYRLHTKQNLPISKETAWSFLSDPKNLKTITPDYMSFDILSGADRKMFPVHQHIQQLTKHLHLYGYPLLLELQILLKLFAEFLKLFHHQSY